MQNNPALVLILTLIGQTWWWNNRVLLLFKLDILSSNNALFFFNWTCHLPFDRVLWEAQTRWVWVLTAPWLTLNPTIVARSLIATEIFAGAIGRCHYAPGPLTLLWRRCKMTVLLSNWLLLLLFLAIVSSWRKSSRGWAEKKGFPPSFFSCLVMPVRESDQGVFEQKVAATENHSLLPPEPRQSSGDWEDFLFSTSPTLT